MMKIKPVHRLLSELVWLLNIQFILKCHALNAASEDQRLDYNQASQNRDIITDLNTMSGSYERQINYKSRTKDDP